ncbi:hypothetical protein FN846DRAFT_895410 [Sphaerosporella brunnea]|uniref:Uncharacterized protein n=1 Tax=Sphaerosporella brunnea TaxID=1250544 RepID=A0A5J5EFF2_9PEZI|nr:hypothetical protein FN846DRAFT_895410 [Sphaerosporella brunnea]
MNVKHAHPSLDYTAHRERFKIADDPNAGIENNMAGDVKIPAVGRNKTTASDHSAYCSLSAYHLIDSRPGFGDWADEVCAGVEERWNARCKKLSPVCICRQAEDDVPTARIFKLLPSRSTLLRPSLLDRSEIFTAQHNHTLSDWFAGIVADISKRLTAIRASDWMRTYTHEQLDSYIDGPDKHKTPATRSVSRNRIPTMALTLTDRTIGVTIPVARWGATPHLFFH